MSKNRKQELLEIAYKMFITKGYDNTSVDEIIKEADIAKGTFYYYFDSKDEVLDLVINDMIDKEIIVASKYIEMQIPIEQKLIGIITSLRPSIDEKNIAIALNDNTNIKMHRKYNDKLIDSGTKLLKEIILEGINKGIFNCNNIEERIKLLLIMSNELFDNNNYSEKDIEVFVDTTEKMLGASKGSMNFIANLIGGKYNG